ncbi:ganglioside induced differentiation associated protein [Aspergillus japonicus CBS 114.51]|uniref:Ganglioside induced differentiation associated protein n=1 Tax=Aspergillus japonicus CBS 114.51 TaxID=1448312 RepID=A0A8T8XFN5_ASPJA|nr:ganglioside induced differentiation associated protein [Aspergillus japonicus CBS 114.51]RAH86768.1 ganglioside induced differentiation associated protein [Aspergillus japonicus CBS 114.51]
MTADFLPRVLRALVRESRYFQSPSHACAHHGHNHSHVAMNDHIHTMETWAQIRLMKQLLCVRHPRQRLDPQLLREIEGVLLWEREHRALIDTDGNSPLPATKLYLWQGDITTLTNLTAITNAANTALLGCFQPAHRCIDNVIHARAGPGLREECFRLMDDGHRTLPVGDAIVTAGYCLPAPWIIHTVGPQLDPQQSCPTEIQRAQLKQCYRAVLEQAESLPSSEHGKAIALCGISTGLFGYPVAEAASLAVETVVTWLRDHPETSITGVIFNTFTEKETVAYERVLALSPSGALRSPPKLIGSSMRQAHVWLQEADTILLSCGAGLSAATGLDYTSTTLFDKHFPAFRALGLAKLYDTFGMKIEDWGSEEVRWGFYFTHLQMVRTWPQSAMYSALLEWIGRRFGMDAQRVHVRTSNADGLFLAHGLDENVLSTPQGAYRYLQCLGNCREDAVVESAPLVEKVVASGGLDAVTQRVTDERLIPVCRFCGGKMGICVRAGNWFNESPFEEGEKQWQDFKEDFMRDSDRKVVILELGVGMSTPGVLRWENEELVESGERRARLVRVGMGDTAVVPAELEAMGLATCVDGNLNDVLGVILDQ